LRSGFPLRFSEAEMEAAVKASKNTHDPDGALGIRRDFRHQKVYTIDGASTSEIDECVANLHGVDNFKESVANIFYLCKI